MLFINLNFFREKWRARPVLCVCSASKWHPRALHLVSGRRNNVENTFLCQNFKEESNVTPRFLASVWTLRAESKMFKPLIEFAQAQTKRKPWQELNYVKTEFTQSCAASIRNRSKDTWVRCVLSRCWIVLKELKMTQGGCPLKEKRESKHKSPGVLRTNHCHFTQRFTVTRLQLCSHLTAESFCSFSI